MMLGILFALLSAHLLADFVLQSHRTIEAKGGNGYRRLTGLFCHGLIHFICGFILLTGQWTGPVLVTLAGIILFHLGVDFLKSSLDRKIKANGIWLFLGDQLLHLAAIAAAVHLLALALGEKLFDPAWCRSLQAAAGALSDLALKDRLLASLAATLAGTWGVGFGIRAYFESGSRLNPEAPRLGAPAGGLTIGILERLIIILVLLLRQEALIGFLLAAKSVARFKKFDDDRFIEYFIIGSSVSFLAAMTAGWVVRGVLTGQWV